ncbi:MAG: hypothetical protein KGH94_01635 [Candidatus Micrarchaeota archaeon]|nr:hypothetical protein [Candidatus Micrarchaeota archaeon]
MANNTLMYAAVLIVAVLVFIGAALAVSLLAKPSYYVTLAMSASSPSNSVYPYQSMVFNITVTNNGGKDVVELPVAFYVNGVQQNYSGYVVPAHHSITIQEAYTYLQAGSYLFSAVADPGNVLRLSNASAARKSIQISTAIPESADVYSSVPNANIVNTESFTASGTGLLSASVMDSLYNISSLEGVNGLDNAILAKTYQDLYQYIAVANGAFSLYSNGTESYSAWLQGTMTPQTIGTIVSSFGKNVSVVGSPHGVFGFAQLANRTSMCTYYQNGWTKIVEFYNAGRGGSCKDLVYGSYNDVQTGVIAAALKNSRIGNFSAPNTVSTISWQRFYYNNATLLGKSVEYSANSISASTLFELQSPQGIFLSSIEGAPTNVLSVNSTCPGLISNLSNAKVCSTVLLTSTSIGNRSFGAVYSKLVSSNYTVGLYSLIGQSYLTSAHTNAAELMNELGIRGSQVAWASPFKNTCGFKEGFGCRIVGFGANSTVELAITNLNYSSVSLTNVTCSEGRGATPMRINGTIGRGDNITISTVCHTIPVPVFAAETSFMLNLGFKRGSVPMIVNGTLNVTTSTS